MLKKLFRLSAHTKLARRMAAGLSVLAVIASLAATALPVPASGQVSTSDALRLLQRGGSDDIDDSTTPTLKPNIQTYTPVKPSTIRLPLSHLEEIYRARTNEPLLQFGYDVLGAPQAAAITQTGAIPDRYVLGATDELVISLRGQENATYRLRIDRDGNVTLPKLAPVPAAGRYFGDFRANLEQQIAQTYISTKVFVTLGNIHEISILVSGEVRSPGVRIVSGLASPLDVILLSGGIKKTGSLRSVRVVNGTTSRVIDLYSVIAQGNSSTLGSLRDGDRVYVPPLGATAAVAGGAARPGIYELPPGSTAMSAGALLHLAGGTEIAGAYTMSRYAIQRDGSLSLQPISSGGLIHSGEVLFVSVSRGALTGRIMVYGAATVTGTRPLSTNRSVSEIFRSASDLELSGYAPFGIIRRRDPTTNAIMLVPFSITGAIRKTMDVPLQDEDAIFVLSRKQARALANLVIRDLNTAYTPTPSVTQPLQPRMRNGTSSSAPGQPTSPPGSSSTLPPWGQSPMTPVPEIVTPNSDGSADTTLQGPGSGAPDTSPTNGISSDNGQPDNGQPANGTPTSVDPRFANPTSQDSSSEASALAQAQQMIGRNGRFGKGLEPTPRSDDEVVAALASSLDVTTDALLRTGSDNLAWVLDQVREPGAYIAARGTSISDLIQAAGGYQQSADLSQIEVTSTEVDQASGRTRTTRTAYNEADGQMTVGSIRPLDVVRVRPVYSDREEGTVTVSGEVRYPGVFDITRDERLSSLLQRAGGMTEVAYPYGAIFTRKEAALAEKEGNERSARELENQIPGLMFAQNSSNADYSTAGAYLTSLVRSLREMPALGRIVVTADPTVLATKPELDFVLQPGDTLYVPKRPSTVTVTGEVRNPGSFQYRAGLGITQYLRLAGGTTQDADDSRTFVVMPDGSATPVDASWISFGGGNIPPGATVVVPRDLRPFNWSQLIKDTTQIISQLAVAAASIYVLNRN